MNIDNHRVLALRIEAVGTDDPTFDRQAVETWKRKPFRFHCVQVVHHFAVQISQLGVLSAARNRAKDFWRMRRICERVKHLAAGGDRKTSYSTCEVDHGSRFTITQCNGI